MVFERTARLAMVFDSATGAAATLDLGEDFVVEADFFSVLKLLVSDFFWIAMIVSPWNIFRPAGGSFRLACAII
jgi:hypothetical protein